MSRPHKVYCVFCGNKRLYRTEEDARYALGLTLNGNWKGQEHYSLSVYRCRFRKNGWHIGHNPATIRVIEAAIRKQS